MSDRVDVLAVGAGLSGIDAGAIASGGTILRYVRETAWIVRIVSGEAYPCSVLFGNVQFARRKVHV